MENHFAPSPTLKIPRGRHISAVTLQHLQPLPILLWCKHKWFGVKKKKFIWRNDSGPNYRTFLSMLEKKGGDRGTDTSGL